MSSLMPNDDINKIEYYLNGTDDFYSRRIQRNDCSSAGSFISSPPHLASTTSSNNMAIVNNHGNNIANSSAAFSRLTTFFITDSTTLSNDKTLQLLLEVETRFNEIREEISIRILDPNDPFFIYLYLIDFNEYKKIKHAQNLLVSFEKFSPKLIDLFEKCSTASSSGCSSKSSQSANYILCLRNLTKTMLTLDIVEVNEFKNLIHLTFNIPSASEEFVRNNYCSIYKKLKNQCDSFRQQISSLDDQLSALTISKAKDLQTLKMEFSNEKTYLEEKLKESEQRFSLEQNKWNESDRLLKSKLSKLQFELKNRDELLEKERKNNEQQCQEWKEKLNQEVNRRYNKVKELDDKNQQLVSELDLIRIERDQSSQQAMKNIEEMNQIKMDLSKANEIIRKLQNEVKTCQDKLKILNDVTQKQEEMVGIKESTVERLSMDLKLCLQQLKNKEKDIERLNLEQNRQKSYCSQLELQLSTSKKIIANMNKKLDQLRLPNQNSMNDNNDHFANMRLNDNEESDEDCPRNCDKIVKNPSNHTKKSMIEEPITEGRIHKTKSATNINGRKQRNVKENRQVVEFEDKDIICGNGGGNLRKNFLFTNSTKELALKSVNLRTTNSNRNQTNVLSTQPKRNSYI